MFGWIPVVLFIFATLPPRRAVIASFLIAWLFLPLASYSISGLPDYTKMSATCAGVLMATVLFDPARFLSFRLHWADLPVLAWCCVPMMSSLSNGLGPYDGFSATLGQTVKWGFPYFIGRLYFSDWNGLKELAIGIFIGGLVYVPLCLWEIRMSPQLHYQLYGFRVGGFHETYRFGGWRPLVFMYTGLMVSMWMVAASLTGFWLWWSRTLPRRVNGIPTLWLVAALLITTVLCKSLGALALLCVGIGALVATKWTRSRIWVAGLLVIPVLYMTARTAGDWSADELVNAAAMISEDRAASLETRLTMEDRLTEKALRQPVFGWGGWGRNRVYDTRSGVDITITDGLWVLALGVNGVVGLAALTGAQLMPIVLLLRRIPARLWSQPMVAAAPVLALLLALYAIDNLMNAMVNPIYMLVAGGLTATLVRVRLRQPVTRMRAMPHAVHASPR